MSTLKVYVLPESYEVKSKTLEDIKYVVNPAYTKEEVLKMDREYREKWDLGGKKYVPGTSLLLMTLLWLGRELCRGILIFVLS